MIAIIDDHSRLIPHAEFYLNERLSSYTDCLKQALASRGLPRKLYVDNGSAFRCKQLEHICASLGVALIHSKPYTPEGRGKIERFFRTIRGDFLPDFRGEQPAGSKRGARRCGWRMSITAGCTAPPGRAPLRGLPKICTACARPRRTSRTSSGIPPEDAWPRTAASS
ncbi:MAG: DDE-type integrase/transposase/recombinase [Desulfobacterales bacterium]|nr:DDE-type integrase/transposase/recombinase [Desulfobacterales bacterium]